MEYQVEKVVRNPDGVLLQNLEETTDKIILGIGAKLKILSIQPEGMVLARPPTPNAEQRPSERTAELMASRGAIYGDIHWGYRNFTKALQAMIEDHTGQPLARDLSPDFGVQVHTLIKLMRSIKPTQFHRDSYDDLSTYTDIAYLVRAAEEEKKNGG
jgi:hypothetical protein